MSRSIHLTSFLAIAILALFTGCANIVPPTGGKRDVTPPKLKSVKPADSAFNARIGRIDMRFDEYITVSDAAKEVHISPALAIPLTVTGNNKTVTVKIPDSLLQPNTTYRVTFGNAIKDLHEGNAYSGHSFVFSTGSWFDSLVLKGYVINAKTGLPDSSRINILLYETSAPEDAVVSKKPLYVTATGNAGDFRFDGLPARSFRIFALKEKNDNQQFDSDDEMIAFNDTIVTAGDTAAIRLRMFLEENPDSVMAQKRLQKEKFKSATVAPSRNFTYSVKVDTADKNKRSVEISGPLNIFFNRPIATFNAERMRLSYDSLGTEFQETMAVVQDTVFNALNLKVDWKQDKLYTLRLLKGFVKDTGNADAMPGRFTFRTKRDEDYGTLDVHLPSRFYGRQYLLQILLNSDSFYRQPVTDTFVRLTRIPQGMYTISVIHDENGNGNWDPGDLRKKRQPETVYPYINSILMKPGWEHQVDFDADKVKKR